MKQSELWIFLLCVFQALSLASYALISIRNEVQRNKWLKELKELEERYIKEQREMRREFKGILRQN